MLSKLTSHNSPDHTFSTSLYVLLAEGFLSRLSFGIISFALPIYAYRQLGLSLTETGFLFSLNLIVEQLLKPVMGSAADRFGLKLSFTTAIGLRSLVALLLVFAGSAWQVYAIRIVHGLSESLRDPSVNALIAEHSGGRKIASAFAWYSTAKQFAGALGKGAAGILLTLTAESYSQVFLTSFALSILPLFVVMRYLMEPERSHGAEKSSANARDATGDVKVSADDISDAPEAIEACAIESAEKRAGDKADRKAESAGEKRTGGSVEESLLLRLSGTGSSVSDSRENQSLRIGPVSEYTENSAACAAGVISEKTDDAASNDRPPAIFLFAVLGFLIAGTAHMMHQLFPILAVEYGGLSTAQTGIIYTASTLVILFSGPVFGWLSDNVSRRLVLAVRGIANTASSLVYWLFPSFAGMAAGLIIDNAGKAAFRPAWGSLMTHVSSFDRRHRARTMSYLSVGEGLGETLGPMLGGFLWHTWGIAALMSVRLILALVSEIYAVWLSSAFEKRNEQESLRKKTLLVVPGQTQR